ncbi:PAS domain S-box protein [Massilia arenosa]|uniref:histidine kinase n=1 Tax=Zemynaea arenosa TaxID=2561931 RepID=A0A4Y9SPU1_9BURK|nr:ATP-binding protein [Massilia arenosa]TFW27359.1 PAS domain S-box protein [Massilia arenosa]
MPDILRVLHVEDSADDALLVRAELEQAGQQLHYRRVESGPQLALALQSEPWDVVLSDAALPGFSARGALRCLQASGRDIPFIVVSGYLAEAEAADLMRAGAHDYVMKSNLTRLSCAVMRERRERRVRDGRRQADQALAANRRLLLQIAASLGEGLLVLDRAGKLVFMNPEAERLLGWRHADLDGLPLHDIIHCRRPDGGALARHDCVVFASALAGEPRRAEDEVFIRKDGAMLPVALVATPIMEEGSVAGCVVAFQDVTERRRADTELRDSRRQLQELSAFQQNVREAERRRIARELHDELGQALTALRIDLNWLSARVEQAVLQAKLAGMLDLVGTTVDAVRRLSEDLRPGMLDDLGLAAAVEHHVFKLSAQTGLQCHLDMNAEHFDLCDELATALFRILQEALTNVARHAHASCVHIRLHLHGGEMQLTVQDDGIGIGNGDGQPVRRGFGLLGMRERAKLLGGTLDVSSPTGAGTRVLARLPVQPPQPQQGDHI